MYCKEQTNYWVSIDRWYWAAVSGRESGARGKPARRQEASYGIR
jgi:hypothetical protein